MSGPNLTLQEHETPLAPRPEKCRRLNPRKLTTGCLVERDSPRQFQHGAAHIRMWSSVEDEQSEEVGSFGSLPARYPRACRAADRPGLSTGADSSTEELYDKIAVCTLRPGRLLIRS